ncbi:MAG: sigma-70 family RNA polymerase sigma factor [Gemmatimonadaceae bacterium]
MLDSPPHSAEVGRGRQDYAFSQRDHPSVPDESERAAPLETAHGGPDPDADFQQQLMSVLSPAFGYALRLTRHRADAEDLVQDAALNACRSRHTFEPGSNFKAWFFHILTRCLWSRHRKSERRPSTVDFDDLPELYVYERSLHHGLTVTGDDPASDLIDRIGTERVAAALAQLPEEFAVVCTLYFMEDFAYQEIADVLGVPVGTVRSRLHRGRRMLQKSLWYAAQEAGIVQGPAAEEGA